MILKKLSPTEKVILLLVINTVLFGGIFALRLLGLATNTFLIILTTVTFLEVTFLAISMQISVGSNIQSLKEVQESIKNIKENEEKNQTSLIYIGHQMKVIHHDLNFLRKNTIFKPSVQNHVPKAHA